MKISLSNFELRQLLVNGSTNQKQFVKDLDENQEFDEAIDTLRDWFEFTGFNKDDIRGALNGGALYITDDVSEMSEDVKLFIIHGFDSGLLMIFDTRLY